MTATDIKSTPNGVTMSRSNFSPLSTPISTFELMSGHTRAYENRRTIERGMHLSLPMHYADEADAVQTHRTAMHLSLRVQMMHFLNSRPNPPKQHAPP